MFCFEGNNNFDFFFFFVTAALEVQMLVCMCVNVATTVLDFWRTSERTLDFRLYGLQNSLVYKSQPPDIWDLFIYALTATKILISNLELSLGWSVLIV